MSEIKATYTAPAEPLPCPDCASRNISVEKHRYWQITCENCQSRIGGYFTRDAVITDWNFRAEQRKAEEEQPTTEDLMAQELRRLNELADCGHENRYRYTGKAGAEHCARCEVLQMHNICAGYQDREKALVEAIQAARLLIQPGTFSRPQNAANADYYLEHALETVGAK